jgi:glycosyltransferase involved in cell wall biosynthesis
LSTRVERRNPGHTARSTPVDQRPRAEPDRGVYDALNKGIALATGDAVGFLHSDDLYADEHVPTRIAAAFEDSNVDPVYGDLDYMHRCRPDWVFRQWRSGMFSPRALYSPAGGLRIRRSIFGELYRVLASSTPPTGLLATNEFMLRLLSVHS